MEREMDGESPYVLRIRGANKLKDTRGKESMGAPSLWNSINSNHFHKAKGHCLQVKRTGFRLRHLSSQHVESMPSNSLVKAFLSPSLSFISCIWGRKRSCLSKS